MTPGLSLARERVARWLAHVRAHRGALSASAANQIVSSGTNFVLALFLVRTLPEAEYGAYGLGLAACYLFVSAGNATLLTQMVVHTPDKPPGERGLFAAEILGAVVALGAVTLAVTAAAAFAAGVVGGPSRLRAGFAAAVGFCAVANLLKEYAVRQAYTALEESRALRVNAVVATALAAVLAVLLLARVPLDAAAALCAYGVAQLVGGVAGVLRAGLPIRLVRWRGVTRTTRECWVHGHWALSAVAIWWAQSQGYAYLVAAVIGPAAVGRANAARLLFSPFLLLVTSVNQVAMPRFAELRARDPVRMAKAGTLLGAVAAAGAVAYSAAVLLSADTLIPAVLGPRYTGMRRLAAAWSVALVAMLVRDCAGTLLQAMKEFRVLTVAVAFSAVASLGLVLLLMRSWGVEGAVLGSALGDVIMAALIFPILARRVRAAAVALRGGRDGAASTAAGAARDGEVA